MTFRLRWIRNTLFVRLMVGFWTIIAISFAFNALSFHVFSGSIREELIRYNTLNLANTANGYEKQLGLLNDLLDSFYFNGTLGGLDNRRSDGGVNFESINRVTEQFKAIADDYNLYVNDAFVYYKNSDSVINKTSLHTSRDMFETYYKSEAYPREFWSGQFGQDYHMKLHPSATFQTPRLDTSIAGSGVYFPLIVKSKLYSQAYMAAMLDASAMFEHLHLSVNDNFYIVDDEGRLYYSSSGLDREGLPLRFGEGGTHPLGGRYYFTHRSAATGLTYVNVIPFEHISRQMNSLRLVLIGLIALSAIVSLILSVPLSSKIRHPIDTILESLKHGRKANAADGGNDIHEFIQIRNGIDRMMDSMHRKDSLLRKYGYLDKLKDTNMNHKDVQRLIDTERPHFFLMFHIQYVDRPQSSAGWQRRSTFFLEFVNLNINETFPDSVTLQIEKDVIVSIAFPEDEGAEAAMLDKLHYLKQVFDHDKQHYRLTIAFHPQLRLPSEFSAAYREAADMIRKRKLNDETQIITDSSPVEEPYPLSPEEERQFMDSLLAGNEPNMVHAIVRSFERLRKLDAGEAQYKQFAHTIVSKVLLALMSNKIDTGELQPEHSPFEEIDSFVSPGQFEAFFDNLLGRAAAMMEEKRAQKDPIVDFVRDFIENRYGDDLYLDLIADKLNISPGYLRQYYKEKTGRSISDSVDDVRIRNAKRFLAESDWKVHEIAAKVGYRNANSFIRMFRRLTNMTPGEYRRGTATGAITDKPAIGGSPADG
ncbi:helix-turn-helix transcriptional regulator [Paenibacillus hemerocallicola]|uniref:Helix-turn-helix transcriptional regulator n=1 Tax=Paenibacillus hemerocallicola TaxID=1172614 RepID=A0A5C4TDB2_9BACL|nr:AraC family transcriptional regulator [Paenibacillus hemerocallicola]TNJ67048.1 helix-turn-helix transcriptional regulator [Paenibacillus hemerocallicola]